MQQSEKLDLGPGFLSVVLDAAKAFVVASDLSWRNAFVLKHKVSGTANFTLKEQEKNSHT
jgi:hypothetical protein